VKENYGLIYREADDTSQILSDLVPCIFLKKIDQNNDYVKVEMPDGQQGYIKRELLLQEQEYQNIKITKERIVERSRKFLGIPYLWGGNSSKAFDCSGFVQTVFRLLNYGLPRDSGPMSREGTNIPLDENYNQYEIGDLLFFGKTATRVNHVAIYMGDGLYIHARGKVGINSLNASHPLYEDYLKSLFVKVQRIL
jgi:cell wall-associated NlpC family hydrolase